MATGKTRSKTLRIVYHLKCLKPWHGLKSPVFPPNVFLYIKNKGKSVLSITLFSFFCRIMNYWNKCPLHRNPTPSYWLCGETVSDSLKPFRKLNRLEKRYVSILSVFNVKKRSPTNRFHFDLFIKGSPSGKIMRVWPDLRGRLMETTNFYCEIWFTQPHKGE